MISPCRSAIASAVCAALIAACGDAVAPKVAEVAVTPATWTLIALGDTVRLTAVAKTAGGEVLSGKTFIWTSSDTTTATVDATSGVVTAIRNGAASISATTDGLTGTAMVQVSQRVDTVTVTPSDSTLDFAMSVQLTVLAKDRRGNPVANVTPTWSTGDSSIAIVGAAGRAKGTGVGTTAVTATISGKSDAATLTFAPITFAVVRSGGTHACGITTNGRTYCWGPAGYIGDSTLTRRLQPEPVVGGHLFQSISPSRGLGSTGGFTCALTATGAAYCWGLNDDNQLGDGTTQTRTYPVAVLNAPAFVQLAAGSDHACGLTAAGAAYCWGRNTPYGQLGDGTTMSRSSAVAVAGGVTFTAVSAGSEHTCGLTAQGEAHCWGSGFSGQLGNDSIGSSSYRLAPAPVLGGHTFQSLVAGGSTTCGLTSGGFAYCWGSNLAGQVGDGTTSNRARPTLVSGGLAFASIDVGGGHTCGLTADGTPYCWGNNYAGVLGIDPPPAISTTPIRATDAVSFSALSTGGFSFNCGIALNPIAYCWGDNSSGQLGNNTTTRSTVPAKIRGQP
jgi:alpha-tubulin suppressor-like RCC1 family protein